MRYFVNILFVIVAFVSAINTTEANIKYENIRFKQLSIADELPNNTIHSIVQDRRGYMWFGTKSGLCKFDGYELSSFYNDPADSSSLYNNIIHTLYDDHNADRLWILTEDGICSYDHQQERFTHHEIEENSRTDVKFTMTKDQRLLINTSIGVYAFDEESEQFVPYILLNNKKWSVDLIVCDRDNILWIKSGLRLRCYDQESREFIPLPHQLEHLSSDCRKINYLSSMNCIIFRTSNGVFGYDISADQLYRATPSLEVEEFRVAERDHEGNIWLGSEYGIAILNHKFEQIAHFQQSNEDLSALNDSPIYSIFRDQSDGMWVGTYFGGVNYYAAGSDQFQIYHYGSSSNHLSGKAVRGMANAPDGGVYIATEDGGLNYLSADRKILRAEEINRIIGVSSVVDAKNVHSVMISEGRYLWVGFLSHSLIRYDLLTGDVVDYGAYNFNASVFCFCEDSDGNIWCGGPNGIFLIAHDAKDSTPIKVSGLRAQSMIQFNDTSLLIGTRRGGLHILDIATHKTAPLEVLPTPNSYTTYLYRDSQRRIWVGMNNDKLYQTDSTAQRIIATYSKEEIGSADIKSIVEDNQNNIWVASGNGLCRINPNNHQVSRYSVADGLPTNQFNFASACKLPSGELLFGTINGLISFHPNELLRGDDDFNVVLTNIWSNTQRIPTDDITLSYKQAQSLTILYSGLNYQYGDNTLYAMKMDGVDDDWQYVGTQHQVRFSNLSEGDYVLRIKASGDGVNWDEEGACSIPIKILPPWWRSVWAYIAYLLAIALAIYLFVHYTKAHITLEMRLKNEQTQRESIELMNRQKSSFFTYVSHDLRTPLTLILSPLKQMIEKRDIDRQNCERLEVVYRNATRMNDLIDELLTHSKIEMKQMKMNLRRGDIMLFLKELSQIFGITAVEREMEFEIDVDELGCEVWFSPSKLERIIYNLLSNAFKYTPNGGSILLKARFLRAAKDGATLVEISVKDSGRGIDKKMQSKIFENYYQVDKRDQRLGFGLGLSLTRSLVQLHKGTIRVVSEPNQGSEFIITINVSKESFAEAEYSTEEISQREQERHNRSLRDRIEMIPNRLREAEVGVEEMKPQPKPTILIVEDSLDMNQYICEIFAEQFIVLSSYNGAEALKSLEEQQPDIIICDVMMPIMDGLEFTSKVKGDLNTSHIPIILLTAKSEIKEHTEGYIAGAEGYITKPFDAQNLHLLVENTLRNRAQNRERFQQQEDISNLSLLASNSRDSEFMQQLIDLVMENLGNENFGVIDAIAHLGVSRSLLHNKLKSLSGSSFTQFVRSIKMKEAKLKLAQGLNISEVTFALGMSDPSYFTKCFKKEFNVTPTEFLKELK